MCCMTSLHLVSAAQIGAKMSKMKKSQPKMDLLPNYSQYDYAMVMPPFRKHERLDEREINNLICADKYMLELHLNQLTDATLQDYLYMLYRKKKLDTPKLIRKLVIFFVSQYQDQLLPRIKWYLDAKKLTLDEWLNAVKNQRRGDILCLYFLNMITGRHTCIHLKGGHMWSTLNQVPVDHNEHVKCCDLHLAYLGFGAFIKLIPRPVHDNKNVIVLGTVTADDPATLLQLKQMVRDQESVKRQHPKVRPTAAAGSEQDLARVKLEMDPSDTSVTRKIDSRHCPHNCLVHRRAVLKHPS